MDLDLDLSDDELLALPQPPIVSVSCHCGLTEQTVYLRDDGPHNISLCHCAACRHSTGMLYASYVDIKPYYNPRGLVSYASSTGCTRYFCVRCGCHVFRRLAPVCDDGLELTGSALFERIVWSVATGTIISCVKRVQELREVEETVSFARHVNTGSTKDGGLSLFLPGFELAGDQHDEAHRPYLPTPKRAEDVLYASCHCKYVRFHITRPNESSCLPRSNFPDLMIPYHTKNPLIQNPEDVKWWLRPGGRYLAGTCACRSCRLTSGFEIQTWAFVPRANIHMHISSPVDSSSPSSSGNTKILPLDFTSVSFLVLESYESSPGVIREFCPHCGATVLWRDTLRPELVDVSVGLFEAEEGARAETWLEWWRERVSFSEYAGDGRTGEMGRCARGLIGDLERGLSGSEGKEESGV